VLICDSLLLKQIWRSQIGKPHPIELRERVVALVEDGNTHHAAAAHFRVSVKFVNDMVILKRQTGSLKPKTQGNGGWNKLGEFDDWLRTLLTDKGDLTQGELVQELQKQHGVKGARSSVGYWLHRLSLSHKKTLLPSEQMRPDVALARCFWVTHRQPFMRSHLERFAFIDETSLKTKMIKTTGWASVGQRLIDHTPFGHWNTQTFIAVLRHDRLDAPWVIKGAMKRDLFNTYVETQLAPTLRRGDVVTALNTGLGKPRGIRTEDGLNEHLERNESATGPSEDCRVLAPCAVLSGPTSGQFRFTLLHPAGRTRLSQCRSRRSRRV